MIGADAFVWVAAELGVARAARAHFRDALALDRRRGYFAGYWSR